MDTVLALLALGLALGIGSSIIPGPCGIAVLGAAQHHGKARAVATAFGAALGDAVYAGLGVAGAGRVLSAYPQLVPAVQIASGALVIGYALFALRGAAASSTAVAPTGSAWRGLVTGLGLSLANPAVLLTWVVLVGGAIGDAPIAARVACVIGISAGTAAWFSMVALVAHQRLVRFITPITRVVCVLLIAYGATLLGRGLL